MIFQGKSWNEDNKDHLITELGDLMWYVMQACIALETPIDYVISRNVDKLMKRYPEGAFSVFYSEHRSEDDR
jgi:NTP pyrophosphatase (non-canonical NTP hydrolase)